MSDPQIIKKYPNRRLYDTARSSYITLDDVRHLVLDEAEFRVVDARTGADITRSVLMQIILEQEDAGEPIFTTRVLEQIIRFYGDSLQSAMGQYLERSLSLFVEQQGRVRQQVQELMGDDTFNLLHDVTEQNLRLWQDMQEGFLDAATAGRSRKRPRS